MVGPIEGDHVGIVDGERDGVGARDSSLGLNVGSIEGDVVGERDGGFDGA